MRKHVGNKFQTKHSFTLPDNEMFISAMLQILVVSYTALLCAWHWLRGCFCPFTRHYWFSTYAKKMAECMWCLNRIDQEPVSHSWAFLLAKMMWLWWLSKTTETCNKVWQTFQKMFAITFSSPLVSASYVFLWRVNEVLQIFSEADYPTHKSSMKRFVLESNYRMHCYTSNNSCDFLNRFSSYMVLP